MYELGIFLTWFGPLYGCIRRLIEPLEAGYARARVNCITNQSLFVFIVLIAR
jgi:hypothetical protein